MPTLARFVKVFVVFLLVRQSELFEIPETFMWMKCKKANDDIIVLDITPRSCLDNCRARPWCTGISYHVFVKLCIVHGDSASEKIISKCKGYVYSDRISWQERTLECGNKKCNQSKATCTRDVDECVYHDCPAPVKSNGTLLVNGNLRTTGAKICYQCVTGFILTGEKVLTCLNSGSWSHPFPACEAVPASPTQTVSATHNEPIGMTLPSPTTSPTTLAVSSSVLSSTTSTNNKPSSTTNPDTTTPSSATTTSTYTTTKLSSASTTPSSFTTKSSSTATISSYASSNVNLQSPTSPSTSTSKLSTTTTSTDPSATGLPTSATAFITTHIGAICDVGWVPYQGSCFYVNDVYRDFSGAMTFCSSNAAKVAVPNTRAENEFIKTIFTGLYNYWIGVTLDIDVWISVEGDMLSYSDWVYGQAPTSDLTQCAVYLNSQSYHWWPRNCHTQAQTLCEKTAS